MLLIVAHHYVVNSGLKEMLQLEPLNVASTLMVLFGAWGKTGINCFVLITGYFMCRSNYSWNKLLKLYLQILFYVIVIYSIFCITGYEKLTIYNILWKIWPAKSIADDFISCFLLFYLFIPFINIFISSLDKKNYLRLVILMLIIFSLLPTIPKIIMTFNYVGWFVILYLIGAYIRNFESNLKISHQKWGYITLILLILASLTVIGMTAIYKLKYIPNFAPYYFISDSNKILSLMIAISSFMFFKDLRIPHSRLINVIGGTTFGVLLIHANSNAMRTWLWKETINCTENYNDDVLFSFGYALGSVVVIFIVCSGIDWFRGNFIEPYLIKVVKKIFTPIQRKVSSIIKL